MDDEDDDEELGESQGFPVALLRLVIFARLFLALELVLLFLCLLFLLFIIIITVITICITICISFRRLRTASGLVASIADSIATPGRARRFRCLKTSGAIRLVFVLIGSPHHSHHRNHAIPSKFDP